eukprot:1192063-Prorocentrum_minimum.AAC.3
MDDRGPRAFGSAPGGESDREWEEALRTAKCSASFGEEELVRIFSEGRRLSFSSVAPKKSVRFSAELQTERRF